MAGEWVRLQATQRLGWALAWANELILRQVTSLAAFNRKIKQAAGNKCLQQELQ